MKGNQMNNINHTKENIQIIKDFVKYLDENFKNHSKTAKTSNNYIDLENSLAFLKDYEKVSDELIKVIANYEETH